MASSTPPEHAVRHLCRLADRVGIWVKSEVNGIEVFVAPGTNENSMARHYQTAADRKAKFVSTNVIPAAPETL
jgi:hypothetical protein